MRTSWFAVLAVACSGGGMTGAVPSDSGAMSAGEVARIGRVSVIYNTISNGASGGLSATFWQATSSACTERTVGPCDVLRCNLADGGTPPVTELSAGTIDIGGGTSSATLAPASDSSYAYGGNLPTYAAGDSITVSASGAAIPAFSTSVAFGSPISITAPGLSGAPVIDHTKDLAITWTGGGSSHVLVAISESVPDRSVFITCVFDEVSGSATVPAGAVSDLEVATLGSGSGQGDLSIFSAGVANVSPGGFPVIVFAGPRVFSALPTLQ